MNRKTVGILDRAGFCRCLVSFSLLLNCVAAVAAETAQKASLSLPGADEPTTAASVYGEGVRSTPWQSPEAERSGFHLPPGFSIRCFAAEPQIAKPLNMAFDDRGRLWVTNSFEYPYPAEGEGRDQISILTDTDDDGVADQVSTFADKLNIPIGVLPYGDGCLCFSIPNIWYLRDTDGDGRCDRREVVLGPFDTTRDTHGMVNALRRGGDGWIYACHGFNNQSEIAGKDGHKVTLVSGNTFRFRPDGSRIEKVTQGQVNPFGMTRDDWGYFYSADCHSKPITQLIPGACYPSFGRPHDGLGFLPPMVDHLHGSTAISGIQYIGKSSPIRPLRGQFISGNVMTSRLNRNRLSFNGATAKGKELPDFMTSDDPWFRPVDIRLGPDGHLYVADFYNKIIGHYEVPLDHPGRDRQSGRIWQIRYQESTTTQDNELDREQSVVSSIRNRFTSGELSEAAILTLLSDSSPRVKVETLRLAEERPSTGDPIHLRIIALLNDPNPHVVRAAAQWLGQQDDIADIGKLLKQLRKVSDDDPVLRQTFRIAIRDQLKRADPSAVIWSRPADAALVSIAMGISDSRSAGLILDYLQAQPQANQWDTLLAHAARHADPDQLQQAVDVSRQLAGTDSAAAWRLLDILCTSHQASFHSHSDPRRKWANELVAQELSAIDLSQPMLSWSTEEGNAWPVQTRQNEDGKPQRLTSSFGLGESYVGKLVSDSFEMPNRIQFWLAGHNGFPDQPDHGKNRIRLIRADDGRVLMEATPPRNDVATKVVWDAEDLVGREVRIECIDGDSAGAYAWVAFGGFQPAWLTSADSVRSLRRSLQWIERLQLDSFQPQLREVLQADSLSIGLKAEIAQSIASLRGDAAGKVILRFLRSTTAPAELQREAVGSVIDENPSQRRKVLQTLAKRLSAADQRSFAIRWASSGAPIGQLIEMVSAGWISPHVLVDATVEQTLSTRTNPGQAAQIAKLTDSIDIDAASVARLRSLQQNVAVELGDVAKGAQLFKKQCAACHQLRGDGEVIGPQLDGAVTRSVDRLLEDIALPDRNVDQAFRTTSFLLDDGRVVVGLIRQENAEELTIVESDGKPRQIQVDSIQQRRQAERSLMPGNLAEVLSPTDLSHLIRFIKQQQP